MYHKYPWRHDYTYKYYLNVSKSEAPLCPPPPNYTEWKFYKALKQAGCKGTYGKNIVHVLKGKVTVIQLHRI